MRPWRDHLSSGRDVTVADLTSEGTLLRAWTRGWEEAPGARLWLEPAAGSPSAGGASRAPGSWWTADEFEAATRRAAGRLRTAGLEPGDRMLWSTPSSVASLVAHVGAFRAGLVVVPANTAYSERELAHIVSDVEASAAVVERPDQAEWVRRAATRTRRGHRPGSGSGRRRPRTPGYRRPGRPGPDLLHLGDHRCAQGGGPAPPQPVGGHGVGDRGMAVDVGGPSGPLPSRLPCARPRRRRLRDPAGRGVGRAVARLRPGRRGGRRRRPPGHPLLRGPHHVPPPGRLRAGRRSGRPAPVRLRLGPAPRRSSTPRCTGPPASPSSSGTA